MSRIDDDSSADRRAEEARLADKRAQERQKKERTQEASAFDRALAQRAGEGAQKKAFSQSLEKPRQPQAPVREARADARPAHAPSGPAQEAAANKALEHEMAEVGGQTQGQQDKEATARGAERRAPQPKAGQPSAEKSPLAASRTDSRSAGEAKEPSASSDRKGDARAEDAAGSAAAGKKGGGVRRAGEEDREGGSGTRDQGGGSKDNAPTPFRLPPAALMAPPPLARPKDAAGHMTAMTREIVDKIVSRVLVGTNAAGASEFRIDLKSSVLKGLTIKVSGGRGKKIRAVFSGSDHEALEALEKNSSELVEALEARGLKLEDLQFEET